MWHITSDPLSLKGGPEGSFVCVGGLISKACLKAVRAFQASTFVNFIYHCDNFHILD